MGICQNLQLEARIKFKTIDVFSKVDKLTVNYKSQTQVHI